MVDLTIQIDGQDRTSRVQLGSLRITDNINQHRDTCLFQVKRTIEQPFQPEVNQEVIIFDGATRIFGGIITNVSVRIESVDHAVYDVQCSDFSVLLERKLILERLSNQTVEEIIFFLLEKYDDEGFTMDGVIGDQTIDQITFNRINFSDVLNMMAQLTGFSWYVDYDKDIHFFPKSQEPAPFNLTDDSGNYIWQSLKIENDFTQIRNIVFIEGGEEEGNEMTEEFTATGTEEERTLYRLGFKFARLPVVLVNSTPQNVGVEFLNPDESFDCLWSFQEKYIRFTDGNIPSESDVVEVTGNPLFKIIGRIQNGPSISQYGPWEFKIKDPNIKSRAEARARARAEIEAYKNGVIEGSFRTYESGLRSGQVITVNSPKRGINEDFLIQRVSFHMRTPEDGEWQVTLATLRTIGIIEFLQSLLKEKGVADLSSDILLAFQDFTDMVHVNDVVPITINVTSAPYMWMPEDPGDDAATISANPDKTPAVWNFFTWFQEAS